MGAEPELRGRAARLARLFPAGRARAARTPFVFLVVLLLGGGLLGLLMLNSALSEGSFKLDDLQKRTKNLTDEEQALQRDIDSYSSPDALQRRARELGMVPGGDPAFLGPDGSVKGVPSAAPSPAALTGPRAPEAMASATGPSGSPAASPSPTATTPAAPSAPVSPAATATPAGKATQAATASPSARNRTRSTQPAPTPTHGR
ncbi:septum formation initiator family protein [Streptomyces sp. LaPpAH-108]|uniref:septum formation initiator family protein n=1 Tax=Streptomyces sp. LaPpAH-108 TaxID=1155714 RepID=UPI00037022B1|nr:septum formation initiator family protein [Streptomyces sp. LaPpAH-108]